MAVLPQGIGPNVFEQLIKQLERHVHHRLVPVARLYRDARVYPIDQGATQILQPQIAKPMLRDFAAGCWRDGEMLSSGRSQLGVI